MKPVKSTRSSGELLRKRLALTTGIGLLLMTASAVFAEFSVMQKLVLPGDILGTVANLRSSEPLFRYGIAGYIGVFALDVLVAWALYEYLKPVHQSLSLLTAWFRVVYAALAVTALFSLVGILRVLHTDPALPMTAAQQETQIAMLLHAFYDGWGIAYIFFGIHLVLLGYLIFVSRFIPRILGIVVLAAGLSYIADYTGAIVHASYALDLSVMLGWGELLFMLWLLYAGLRKAA